MENNDRGGSPEEQRRCRVINKVESGGRRKTSYPGMVAAAGYMWIIFGSLFLLLLLASIVGNIDQAQNRPRGGFNAAGDFSVMFRTTGFVCFSFFAIGLAWAGVKAIKGTLNDTIGPGIASLVVGVLYVLVGIAGVDMDNLPIMVFGLGLGWCFITPAILALVSRRTYLVWLRSQPATYHYGRRSNWLFGRRGF